MIKVFSKEETEFLHNRTILTDVENAVISETGNGDFSLSLDAPISRSSDLIVGNIITAPTPRGVQPFRIYNTKQTLTRLQVKARHIFYDLANSFLLDCRPTRLNAEAALEHIMRHRQTPGKIKLTSDVSMVATAYYIRKTEIEALLGSDNAFINNWGGYLMRDGFSAHFRAEPRSRGYEIALGKNITGLEILEDTSDVATVLLPTFVLEDNNVYMLPEKFVRSELADLYPEDIIRELRVELTEEQRKEKPEALYDYVRSEAKRVFSEGRDRPNVSFRVNFVDLSKTEAYKNLELLTELDIFDRIKCKLPSFDIDVDVIMQAYTYDAIKERFLSMDLGSTRPTGASVQKRLQRTIEDQLTRDDSAVMLKVNAARDKAFDRITGVTGGAIVLRRDREGKPYELLILDTADVNTARNVIRLNQAGIGLSSSGITGPYAIAMTAKDGLYADFIHGLKITSPMIEAGAILANHIQLNAIYSRHIASGAVGANEIAANSILTEHLRGRIITSSKMSTTDFFSLNGTFTGDIRANSGYFKGSVEATSGRFGSLSIVNGSQTKGTYYGGLSGATGSVTGLGGTLKGMGGLVTSLGGSLKDMAGSVKGLGGLMTNMGGSVKSLAGSLNKTLGIHAGPTSGDHTGAVNSSSIRGSLNNVSGRATLTQSSLSGSFNGTATTDSRSGLGGALKSTAGDHKGTVNSRFGTLGGVRYYSSGGYLKFGATVACGGNFESSMNIRASNSLIGNSVKVTYVYYMYLNKNSDERLKTGFKKISQEQIQALYDMNMYEFNYKNDAKSTFGVNATEIFYRTESPLKSQLIKVNDDGYLAVDYDALYSVGLAAIQDLNDRVKKLEGIR